MPSPFPNNPVVKYRSLRFLQLSGCEPRNWAPVEADFVDWRCEVKGEKMQKLRVIFGSILLVLTATFALAQTGSIRGTVTDSAGAVVQGAEIMVRNLESNASRTVTSSSTGAYSVPDLPVGRYEITIKMASFQTFRASDVQLTVA